MAHDRSHWYEYALNVKAMNAHMLQVWGLAESMNAWGGRGAVLAARIEQSSINQGINFKQAREHSDP